MAPNRLRKVEAEISDQSSEPLTAQELREIRYLLQTEKHVAWFWATVRRWSMWIALGVAGIVTFRDNLKTFFNWFVK